MLFEAWISEQEEHIATTDLRISALGAFRQDMVNLISKADEMIAALRGERERVLVEIKEKRALLSPVRRLPSETLFQIFRETVETEISFGGISLLFSVPLWTIELVSRRWRTAALTFPELWSCVNIIISDDGFAEGEYSLLRRLGLQLARSAQSSLSFSICSSDQSSYKKLPSSLELLLYSLPSLEILSILCTNAVGISNHSDLRLACNAPKLHDLTLIDVEDPAKIFSIPWTQITRCSISCAYGKEETPGPDPVRFLKVLSLMANLTICDLVLETFSVEFEAEQVACTKLQELSLISRLLLPSLRVLKAKSLMGSIMPNEEDDFRSIRHAIDVSQSPLTTLKIEHSLIAAEDLLSILRTTPTLEFLKLVDVGPNAITDQTLDELTVRPNEGTLVPRLSNLHLSTNMTFTSRIFVTMVESRQTGVDRMKSVSVCWFTDEDDPYESDVLDILVLSDLHRSEGMEFVLTTQKSPR
ncbi:hypothetical protein F5146DRAFT_1027799 [Armillaria mellea]|nr:hypothetical protein F5146DRAFT_1027799 [Armillaria mellea]